MEAAMADECYDCGVAVLNYPEEYLPDETPLFWAVIDQHGLEPSEFVFTYYPALRALGLI
jgi:hypothetical protein